MKKVCVQCKKEYDNKDFTFKMSKTGLCKECYEKRTKHIYYGVCIAIVIVIVIIGVAISGGKGGSSHQSDKSAAEKYVDDYDNDENFRDFADHYGDKD